MLAVHYLYLDVNWITVVLVYNSGFFFFFEKGRYTGSLFLALFGLHLGGKQMQKN